MKKIVLRGVFGLLAVACLGHATLISPQSIVKLENDASLIVVGSASGTVQTGSVESFSLQIIRVIKGDTTLAGSVIGVNLVTSGSGIPEPGTSQTAAGTGVWFLKQSSGGWLLLPVVQGGVPLSMTFFPSSSGPIPSVYSYGSAASLQDKLASELSSVIETADVASNFQLCSLQYGLLDQLQSGVVSVLYQRMSNSAVLQQQILGLSGLIRGGSAPALLAGTKGAATFAGYPTETGILLQSIRDYFRATDPASIAALGAAAAGLSNLNLPLREAAAHALAAVHTAGTLPYLAALLDDPDSNLRVEAIGGMGAFANGLPAHTAAGNQSLAHLQIPASAPYKTPETTANFAMGSQAIERNESSYVLFWSGWWARNKASLGY